MQTALRIATRTLTRCLVCGSAEVRTDEVVDRGVILLAECPRCEHRWTAHTPIGSVTRPPSPVRQPAEAAREIATAA